MNDTNELQRQILEVVALIPFGKVATYGQIAQLAGLPKHARLVGTVLKNLDEGSQLPWHRVINSQGKVSTINLDENGENRQLKLLKNEGVLLGSVDIYCS
ncbi:UNVERIFIED_CONTAM: atl1 [Trichonephila clavipes]